MNSAAPQTTTASYWTRCTAAGHEPGRNSLPIYKPGIACAWVPDRVSDQPTREAITRLARALGTDLSWHETAAR